MAAMSVTTPAWAKTTAPANHTIVGSGSSTTYSMMQSLDTLFNDSLGCYMTQPTGTQQTLNFGCAKNNQGQQVGEGYTDNPVNDVAVEEPALGSSAGIDQLEAQGTGNDNGAILPSAPVNFARSSRAFATTDYPGLNFVGYATDGVSYFTFPTVKGKPSASNKVKDLTIPQLTGIWNGSINNWDKVGGSNAAICVYAGQISSGTSATWASGLGFSSPTAANAYVDTNPKLAGCKVPAGQTYATSHTLPENHGQPIVQNGDASQAIYFFSYGKFQVVCKPKPTGVCNNGQAGTTPYLGSINGVAPTKTTILNTTFPIIRDLYNVYSNGSFPPSKNATFGFPAASAATINYVSEIGYICKPQTDTKKAQVIDPVSSVWYHTEIDKAISGQGFIPLPLQKTEDINSVDTPATAVLKADGDKIYSPNDPITSAGTTTNEKNGNPSGYCQVYTTDGNTAP